MVFKHILKDELLDLTPYIARHTGDRTVTYNIRCYDMFSFSIRNVSHQLLKESDNFKAYRRKNNSCAIIKKPIREYYQRKRA